MTTRGARGLCRPNELLTSEPQQVLQDHAFAAHFYANTGCLHDQHGARLRFQRQTNQCARAVAPNPKFGARCLYRAAWALTR